MTYEELSAKLKKGEPLTEEQIAWAMQFLSDLDFVPVNTDQK